MIEQNKDKFEIIDKVISQLSEKFILVNLEEIKLFLAYNLDLIDVLFEGYEHIKRIFGNYPIYLEFYKDYEYPEWNSLFIIVKTNYTAEKAVELENKLFEEWLVHIIDKVGTRLNFKEEPLYDM